MRRTFAHGVGGVVSADIAVPDHERELSFYAAILTTGDGPLWREDLSNNRGTPIIGLGARTPEYEALPLQWMPHFQVADVAASAARALEMGGEQLMHGRDADGQSQWAVLADPFGAAFGVIPAISTDSDPADQQERIGCISWLSLTAPDAQRGRDFYREVVGWSATPLEVAGAEGPAAHFEMRREDGTAAAEIRQGSAGHGDIPAVWIVYLPVDDLPESLRRARAGGGEVILEDTDSGYAVLRDPVGVYLALAGLAQAMLG